MGKSKVVTGTKAQPVAQVKKAPDYSGCTPLDIKYHDGSEHEYELTVTTPCVIRMKEITFREEGVVKDSKIEMRILKSIDGDLKLVKVFRFGKSTRMWANDMAITSEREVKESMETV
jgi:hypothetical protein